jgi:hypothetical protein
VLPGQSDTIASVPTRSTTPKLRAIVGAIAIVGVVSVWVVVLPVSALQIAELAALVAAGSAWVACYAFGTRRLAQFLVRLLPAFLAIAQSLWLVFVVLIPLLWVRSHYRCDFAYDVASDGSAWTVVSQWAAVVFGVRHPIDGIEGAGQVGWGSHPAIPMPFGVVHQSLLGFYLSDGQFTSVVFGADFSPRQLIIKESYFSIPYWAVVGFTVIPSVFIVRNFARQRRRRRRIRALNCAICGSYLYASCSCEPIRGQLCITVIDIHPDI